MAAVPSIGRASGVEGARAPDADLTRALYEQYANQIFRYCLHQLGSREEAEDAVQSTFLNAFRGIKRGIVPELESAWLFKIAHNVCLSRRRSTWRRGRIESPADFEIVEELAQAPSRRAEELIGFQDVLELMPEQQRRAILLREWQGLSYREIADELELSQAAVETLIFRARRALAQGLEQPVQLMERKRARRAAGALGNLLSSAQGWLLGGGAAAKVAATVAVVSAGTVVATAPVHERAPVQKPHAARAGAVQHARASAQQHGTSSVAGVPPVSEGGVQRTVAPERARPARHLPAASATPLAPAPATEVAADPAPAAPAAAPVDPAPVATVTPTPAPAAPAPVVTPSPPAAAAPAQPQQQQHGASDKSKDAKPATTPVVTPQAPPVSTPPGQAKKSDDPRADLAPVASDATPPGQAKKSDDPPGQSKKSEIAAAPPAGTTPVQSPAAAPSSFVPPPFGTGQALGDGNGSDNGKAKGRDK